jgi:hypothetical protein
MTHTPHACTYCTSTKNLVVWEKAQNGFPDQFICPKCEDAALEATLPIPRLSDERLDVIIHELSNGPSKPFWAEQLMALNELKAIRSSTLPTPPPIPSNGEGQ